MKHLGDITKIHGYEIEPVHCITFGSPCQGLSQAGKRLGLEDERSGLFVEAIRIVKEMREATNGIYPNVLIWENVFGALSCSNGDDFHAVLEEFAHIREPDAVIPRPKKWSKAGLIAGNGWSCAWRVLDAQYHGVPQRRRRIAALVCLDGLQAGDVLFEYIGGSAPADRESSVMDIRGECAGEILFERTGLQGNPAQSIEPWKGVARNPEDGTGGHDCAYAIQGDIARGAHFGQNGVGAQEDVSYTLNTVDRHAVAYLLNDQGGGVIHVEDGNVAPTLRAESHGHEPNVVYCFQPKSMMDENWVQSDKKNAIRAGESKVSHAIVICGSYQDKTGTLSPGAHAGSYNGQDAYNDMLVTEPIVLDSRGNCGGKIAPAIRVSDYTAVCAEPKCYGIDRAAFNQGMNAKYDFQIEAEKSATLVSRGPNAVCHCIGADLYNCNVTGDVACSITTATGNGSANTGPSVLQRTIRWIVRRLTPRECAALQGFPRDWCDIGQWVDSKGKVHKDADSPKYKAFGNSIALPQWWWLVNKMKPYLPEGAKLGSLFDGIGGFPLVWEETYGKGTARWASEIEEFPIAVTKYHFKEE